ncbi:ESAT-6 protein secretion system EspG family protein [Herbihabitans rhizosphaerae]|uniref:ESAT-6 protein secretion system EspG family protein n=1 Tax=Herbihabitans rhizosphaerae TaxID=1872711 RepID=A0A4Q7KCT1_9PSEU|nr:ESX secretion-associated protein EspG [Herbihabitans rhizosphaerae]RZS31319.1 ESAT-6 protein secretion system EspG family protein [Herbihabitans rhizosphaerae]
MAFEFTLSLTALTVLAEHLHLDLRPAPFELPSLGRFAEDRRRVVDAVWIGLSGRRLASQRVLAPDVDTALRLLAEAETTIVVSGSHDGRTIAARACSSGRFAVLAVGTGRAIRCRMTRPAALVRDTVGLLPDLGPGPSTSATITEQPKTGGGSFAVSRGQPTRETTAPRLSWLDTEAGRYLVEDTPERTAVMPADRVALTKGLHALLAK